MRVGRALFVMAGVVRTVMAEPSLSETPTLQLGKRQVQEGQLSDAVLTLDKVIVDLRPLAETRRNDLVEALVHKGWALVRLGQEEPAKAAFRESLNLDGQLRLSGDKFPDRVVRVFEAARVGKTKSVMDRPSGAPKKAGIGALGIAGIAAGAVLIVGGVAAAAGDSTPSPVPTPSPTPNFTKYYGRYEVVYRQTGNPSGCPRTFENALGQTWSTMTLTGNADGSNFRNSVGPWSAGVGTLTADGRFQAPSDSGVYFATGQTDGTTISGLLESSASFFYPYVCSWDFNGARR